MAAMPQDGLGWEACYGWDQCRANHLLITRTFHAFDVSSCRYLLPRRLDLVCILVELGGGVRGRKKEKGGINHVCTSGNKR
jgi:hypothetical protein